MAGGLLDKRSLEGYGVKACYHCSNRPPRRQGLARLAPTPTCRKQWTRVLRTGFFCCGALYSRNKEMAYQDLDQWTPVLPENRQNDVDFEVYASHAATRHCERLLKGDCTGKPCDLAADGTYPVDFDHIVPRASGGDSSLSNTRFLCANQNRTVKRAEPDPIYQRAGFFDQPLHDHRLRPAQRAYGASQVAVSYKELFQRMPDSLFKVFMVLAWVVGTGKTLGMVGIAMAINQVRREYQPAGWRVKRTLWLVHQETLIEATSAELGGAWAGKRQIQSELVEHGIVDNAPTIRKVSKPEDWILGMPEDIVLATPQSLWEANGRVLSPSRREQILAGFDLIVVDEGHFAIDRYQEICDLAPKALKFVMTSTPFDREMKFISDLDDGRYRDRFRLFSAVGLDSKIHKAVLPVFRDWPENPNRVEAALERYQKTGDKLLFPEINADAYHRVRGGVGQVGQGLDLLHQVEDDAEHYDSPRIMAIIDRCREIANQPPTGEAWGYDPHVMLKFGSIKECRFFAKEINEVAATIRRPEWGAVEIYAGAKGDKLGSPQNPWMLAKGNNGMVLKGSKRFACTIDIGQFGINQPACAVIGWIDASMSIIEIVQRLGRAIRRRGPMGGTVQVVWNAAKDKDFAFTLRLHLAVNYMNNLVEQVEQAFLPLLGLEKDLSPLSKSASDVAEMPRARKLEIAEVVGELLLENPRATTDEMVTAVDYAIYGGSGGVPDKVKEFIDKVTTNGDQDAERLRDSLFFIPEAFTPIRYIREEQPPAIFPDSEVENAISRHPDFSARSKQIELESYRSGDSEVRALWQQLLHDQLSRSYEVPQSSYHPREVLGVCIPKEQLQNIEGSYAERLRRIFAPALRQACERADLDFRFVQRELSQHIARALQRSAARALGLPNFKLTTLVPVKDQIAHALCCPDVEQAVLSLSYGRVMKGMSKFLPGLNAIFHSQIIATSEFVDQAVEAN